MITVNAPATTLQMQGSVFHLSRRLRGTGLGSRQSDSVRLASFAHTRPEYSVAKLQGIDLRQAHAWAHTTQTETISDRGTAEFNSMHCSVQARERCGTVIRRMDLGLIPRAVLESLDH